MTTFNDFIVVFLGIFIQGIPFILIGAGLSGLLGIIIKPETIQKLLPQNYLLKSIAMALLGNFFPVCECGNIPFSQKLIEKKIPINLVVVFLLAAPVLNPIVIFATIVAFPQSPEIVIFRVIFTIIVAISCGYLLKDLSAESLLSKRLNTKLKSQLANQKKAPAHHQHNKIKDDTSTSNNLFLNRLLRPLTSLRPVFEEIQNEFLSLASLFIMGAIIAAAIQIFIPSEIISQFSNSPVQAILAMMALAFVISICSNVDAFFALGYSQFFPQASIIAFLVLGPMLDIKAIPMLKKIFSWRTVLILCIFIPSSVFFLSYISHLIN